MKVLELFAGTRSIGRAFESHGHQVFSVEWDKRFENIDLYADVLTVTDEQIIKEFGRPDVIWASPDCTTYSVAAISTHRKRDANGNLLPVTEYARFCDNVNAHVVELIKKLAPKYWFIENPVGGLRKMDFMKDMPRYTVTYCQYGERRQKPTDMSLLSLATEPCQAVSHSRASITYLLRLTICLSFLTTTTCRLIVL